MLRADFHHHIDTDPIDGSFVAYSAGELIDRAVAVGINVLAITCHESIPYDGDAERYARERDVLLLRGMEATVDGHHVLLLNFRDWPPGRCTMADVRARKTGGAMVIAPHPFYPTTIAGGDRVREHWEVFDAVEFSGLYTRLTRQFNRAAWDFAQRVGLPVVGNTDTHFLWQLGRTYTRIDAPMERDAVLEAIRHGRVQLVTQPLSWIQLIRFLSQSHSRTATLRASLRYMVRVLRRTRRAGLEPRPFAGAAPSLVESQSSVRARFEARKAS